MANLSLAALALLEQIQRNSNARVQQTMKAFVGLGLMIVVPVVMLWWARKRYRP